MPKTPSWTAPNILFLTCWLRWFFIFVFVVVHAFRGSVGTEEGGSEHIMALRSTQAKLRTFCLTLILGKGTVALVLVVLCKDSPLDKRFSGFLSLVGTRREPVFGGRSGPVYPAFFVGISFVRSWVGR